jgi:hypothetical protein
VRHMLLNSIDGFGGLMGQMNFHRSLHGVQPVEADNGDTPLASCLTARGSLQTAAPMPISRTTRRVDAKWGQIGPGTDREYSSGLTRSIEAHFPRVQFRLQRASGKTPP